VEKPGSRADGLNGPLALKIKRNIGIAKRFFCYGKPYNPPFKKKGNCKELLLKSTFEKGGVRGIWEPPTGWNLWQTLYIKPQAEKWHGVASQCKRVFSPETHFFY
jgi:hypothetical protein